MAHLSGGILEEKFVRTFVSPFLKTLSQKSWKEEIRKVQLTLKLLLRPALRRYYFWQNCG
jgi:hypothetical protein